MRTTKYILVTIGILGMISAIYVGIVNKEVLSNIPSFIASLSLAYLGMYKVVPDVETCPVKVEKTKDSF